MDMMIPGALNPHGFYMLDTRDMRIFYLEPMAQIKYEARTMIEHQGRLLIRGDGLVITGSLASYGDGYDWNGPMMDRFVRKAIERHQRMHNLFITDDKQYLIGIEHCLPNYSVNAGIVNSEQMWRGPLLEEPPMPDVVALYNRGLSLYIKQGEVIARYYRNSIPNDYEPADEDLLRNAGLYLLD